LRPGSRRARYLAVAGVALAVAVVAGVLVARPHNPSARYGGIPSWLPKATIPVGRIVTASAAHPALAIQGDTVAVHLATGRVLATAVGPAVPEEGHFPVPATSKCTFTVTFTRASGLTPLSSAAFTSIDERGHLHRLRVTAQNGGRLPADIAPGQTVTLTIKGRLPTGNGQLRWAPEGAKPIVSWDFDVEID
jgi:hypothetical protein